MAKYLVEQMLIDPLMNPPSPSQVEAAEAIRALPDSPQASMPAQTPIRSGSTSDCGTVSADRSEEHLITPHQWPLDAHHKDEESLQELVASQQLELAAQHLELKRLRPQLKAAEGECHRLGGRMMALCSERDTYLSGLKQASQRLAQLRAESEASEAAHATERREDSTLYQQNLVHESGSNHEPTQHHSHPLASPALPCARSCEIACDRREIGLTAHADCTCRLGCWQRSKTSWKRWR